MLVSCTLNFHLCYTETLRFIQIISLQLWLFCMISYCISCYGILLCNWSGQHMEPMIWACSALYILKALNKFDGFCFSCTCWRRGTVSTGGRSRTSSPTSPPRGWCVPSTTTPQTTVSQSALCTFVCQDLEKCDFVFQEEISCLSVSFKNGEWELRRNVAYHNLFTV